ncbi:hypothetical protein BOX15_Mlig008549g2, partial [Macrostomum lignano]
GGCSRSGSCGRMLQFPQPLPIGLIVVSLIFLLLLCYGFYRCMLAPPFPLARSGAALSASSSSRLHPPPCPAASAPPMLLNSFRQVNGDQSCWQNRQLGQPDVHRSPPPTYEEAMLCA